MTMNIMQVGGHSAVVEYDPEIEMFHGDFIGLNGGADFYAKDVQSLKKEAELSLRVFLEVCEEQGIEPLKEYSGKFNVRIDPRLHASLAAYARAQGGSLNTLVSDVLARMVQIAELTSEDLVETADLAEQLVVQHHAKERPREGGTGKSASA